MLRRSQVGRAARCSQSLGSIPGFPRPGDPPLSGFHPADKAANIGPPGRPDRVDAVINAYVDGNELVLVLPDAATPSGVRLRRQPAEYSCQIRQADASDTLRRMLRESRAVAGLSSEGEWLRVRWRTADDCRDYCKALHAKQVPTYEGGVDPVMRWMADSGAAVAPRRLAYLDLESDSRVPFSRLREMRILSWAVVGPEGERVEVLASEDEAAERALLLSLWSLLDRVDQVAAWNGDKFDFLLLKARTEHHGISVPWKRWLWIDHMELFRKSNVMAAESGDEKQSFSLGAIAQAVVGESKDDMDASRTWEAWAAGGEERERLARYNLQDSRLMERIERKTGYIALLGTLAEACGSFPDSRGMHATVQTESMLERLAVRRGHRFPTPGYVVGKAMREAFRGAYVMEPAERGIIKNVHVADFSSLYPTIIRTWNMSPETRRQSLLREKEIDGYVRRGARVPLLREAECIAPITGVVFARAPEGMLSGAVAEMMKMRREWNERKAAAAPGTDEWRDADRRATAYKIAANSCYGATGMPAFRHYDVMVAESVSQCAVWLILQTIAAAEERGLRVIYSDTDSVLVTGCTRDEFSTFVQSCNEELYPRILRCVGCEPGLINLAYEKAFERIVLIQKKRYVGRYSHYKGTAATADSRPEVKGLEYKRGDSIRLARRMQEEAVNLLVGQERGGVEDPAEYKALLDRWRACVLNDPLELDDVVIVKGLNKPLREYAVRKKKDGSDARQLPHIEIAKVLAQRGRQIGEGARIGYVVVDGSTAPQTVIPAEDWAGEVDRVAAWESLVAPPTLRLLEAAFPGEDWRSWSTADPTGKKRRAKSKLEAADVGPSLFDRGHGESVEQRTSEESE